MSDLNLDKVGYEKDDNDDDDETKAPKIIITIAIKQKRWKHLKVLSNQHHFLHNHNLLSLWCCIVFWQDDALWYVSLVKIIPLSTEIIFYINYIFL